MRATLGGREDPKARRALRRTGKAQRGGHIMALLFERTRRGREKIDRLEVRRVSGRPGDRGELVARVALRFPLRFPRRVRELLAEGRAVPVRESAQRPR